VFNPHPVEYLLIDTLETRKTIWDLMEIFL
jgi:hypothetical protein